MKNKKKLIECLKRNNSFYVSGHVQPDGDSIGSVLGLYNSLREIGKKVVPLTSKKEIPPQYHFLPGVKEFVEPSEKLDAFDVFISIDAPNTERLGEAKSVFNKCKTTVNIDHHLDNTNFADINVVELKASSVSEIIFWVLEEAGIPVGYDTALCLYTGIVTDTGRFQYSNTSALTFEAARLLVEKGVSPRSVFEKVYENLSYSALKLLGKVMEKSQIKDGIIWSSILKDEVDETGTQISETETFIDYLRSVSDAKIAALFKQVYFKGKPEWRVSLRAKNGYDVQIIAQRYEGGGHKEAAGFRTSQTVEETVEEIFKDLVRQEALKNRNQ